MSQQAFTNRSSPIMMFRCLKRYRAEQLLRGEVYFGSPSQWIQIEKEGNKGQGDLLEGAFFSAGQDDESLVVQTLKSNPYIDCFTQNGFVFFRRKSVLDLRCLCLYGLQDSFFRKTIGSDGRAHYNTSIPRSYFADFTEYETREDYEKADPAEQPVVVLIINPYLFFSRIVAFLHSLAVREEEIIISPVEYCDRYRNMIVNGPSPYELLLKDNSFEDQREVRIIVNSTNPLYTEYMREHNNTLNIGSIGDIAEIYDYYYEDMRIERIGNKSVMLSLPNPIRFNIHDLDYFQLEDLLFSILRGTMQLTRVPENSHTLQEKLQFIVDVFYKKYGVVVHVDENKHVVFNNLTQELMGQFNEKYNKDIYLSQFTQQVESFIHEEKPEEAKALCLTGKDDLVLAGAANYHLGLIYLSEQNDMAAISAFSLAYENDYKRIESLDGIASIYFNRGEYEKAIDVYQAIQEEKGYDPRIWCNIGICYIRLGNYEESILWFDKAIAAAEKDAFPYYNKGVAYYMLKQYPAAKECMEKAIDLDPTNEIYRTEYKKCFFG